VGPHAATRIALQKGVFGRKMEVAENYVMRGPILCCSVQRIRSIRRSYAALGWSVYERACHCAGVCLRGQPGSLQDLLY
jgi:hypothetical protein